MDRRDTSAGRSAGLRRLEFLAVRDTAADLFYDLAQCCSHGNFHKTDVRDLSAEREYLGALGRLRTDGGVPVSAFEDDLRHVGICLNVVENSGFSEKALDSRERRSRTGLAALAFNGGHQRRLLAADECACTEPDLNVKIEARAEDVIAQ